MATTNAFVESLLVLFFPDSVNDAYFLLMMLTFYAYMCSWRLRKTDIAEAVDIIST